MHTKFSIIRQKRGRERGREKNRRKGRSASSACLLSSCATEERIERCCVRSRTLALIYARFIVVLHREVRVFPSFFFFFSFVFYYSLSSTLIYLFSICFFFFMYFFILDTHTHSHTYITYTSMFQI